MIHAATRTIIIANLYLVESADFLFIMQQRGYTLGYLPS